MTTATYLVLILVGGLIWGNQDAEKEGADTIICVGICAHSTADSASNKEADNGDVQ